MTSGLVKGRNTIFVKGYAVQWFTDIFKNTKIMIYVCVPGNTYTCMTEITLDYIADEFSVKETAKEKIEEIHARGKIPMLVGGTGLYISSLVNNISFAEEKTENIKTADNIIESIDKKKYNFVFQRQRCVFYFSYNAWNFACFIRCVFEKRV